MRCGSQGTRDADVMQAGSGRILRNFCVSAKCGLHGALIAAGCARGLFVVQTIDPGFEMQKCASVRSRLPEKLVLFCLGLRRSQRPQCFSASCSIEDCSCMEWGCRGASREIPIARPLWRFLFVARQPALWRGIPTGLSESFSCSDFRSAGRKSIRMRRAQRSSRDCLNTAPQFVADRIRSASVDGKVGATWK